MKLHELAFQRSKRPLVLVLVVASTLIYYIVNYQHQKSVLNDSFNSFILAKESNFKDYLEASRYFGEANKLDRLHERLEAARKHDFFDFYALQIKGKTLWSASSAFDSAILEMPFTTMDQLMVSEKLSFQSTQIAPDTTITIGASKDRDYFINSNMAKYRGLLIDDAIYVVFIVGAVAFWALRDILSIVSQLRQGQYRSLNSLKSKSRESDLLIKSLQSSTAALDISLKNKDDIERLVLSALKKELFSGQTPPYDFYCTLVRTDVNNFVHIYKHHDVSELMTRINQFFILATEIIHKYQGIESEFVGDEIIYYFKDQDHENSALAAVSAIREINEVAAKLNFQCQSENGYPFTVKSSLAYGKLRFGPLVKGYSVAGSTLIETARILSQITEKSGNQTFFSSLVAEKLQGICTLQKTGQVTLRGFPEAITLYQYIRHIELAELLNELDVEKINNLSYFRRPQDLMMILAHLKSCVPPIPEQLQARVLNAIKPIRLSETHFELQTFVLDWIEELLGVYGVSSSILLPTLIQALPSLTKKGDLQPNIYQRLRPFLTSSHDRLVANTLEVLHKLEAVPDTADIAKLLAHKNSRVMANTLILLGRYELNAETLRGLRRVLESKLDARLASGLYALGEIAAFYKRTDLVFFRTHEDLNELLQRMPQFLESADLSVQSQALDAIQKALALPFYVEEPILGIETQLRKELLRIAGRSKNPDLKRRVQQVLGIRSPAASKAA